MNAQEIGEEDIEERKRRDSPRNRAGRREDAKLKPLEEVEEETIEETDCPCPDIDLEERRKRDTPRDNPRREAAKLKVNEEEEELDLNEVKTEEDLDEWYNRGLYERLLNNWTK